MKKTLLTLLLAVFTLPLMAAEHYLMPRYGVMDIRSSNASMLSTMGVYGGYPLFFKNFTVEAELLSGLAGGEYSLSQGDGRFNVSTAGLYGTYRFGLIGGLYAKGRLGALTEFVQNDQPVGGMRKSYHGGLSSSAGLGFATTVNLTLEFDATIIEQDIMFYGLGAHYRL